ncbi:kelch-like protein 12 [Mytilus edulis]
METCNPFKLYLKDFQNGMQHLREDDLFHDVVLDVQGQTFPCHRVILSAFSNYFRGMFVSGMVESNKNIIELKGLEAKCISKVLDYLYGNITIDPIAAEDILAIAVYLQIDCLRETCELTLGSNLDNSNVIRLWNMSSKEYPECTILRNFCEVYMLSNFSDFSNSAEALHLEPNEVIFLLQHEELCAPTEDVVCEFLMHWFQHDLENRKCYLEDLFKCSNFPLLSGDCLTRFIEHFPLMREDCLQPFVQDAIVYQSNPAVQLDNLTSAMDFRLRSSRETSIVVISFAQNVSDAGLHIEMWRYGLHEKHWEKMASLPSYPGIGFSTCTYGESTIFLSGGSTASTFFKFDGSDNRWEQMENLPETRCRHCMVGLDDYIYILGGTTSRRTNAIERFCLDLNTWERCGDLQMAVDDSSVATAHDKIYVFGGFSPDFDILKMVQCYDTVTKTTTIVSVVPNMYDLIDAVGTNDNIYIIGRQSGKVMKFIVDNAFEPVRVIPRLQDSYGIIKHGDSLFLLINDSEESDDIEDRSITSVVEVNLKTGEKTVDHNPLLNTKFDCHCHKLVISKNTYSFKFNRIG